MDETQSDERPIEDLTTSDEEELKKLAQYMKENAPSPEDKQNAFTFLTNVTIAKDTTRLGNLIDDEKLNELGIPKHSLRGFKEFARISSEIIQSEFLTNYFNLGSANITETSLSRGGFLVRQATTQVKQVADVTKRRVSNKGWFKKKEQVQGGDPYATNVSGGTS